MIMNKNTLKPCSMLKPFKKNQSNFFDGHNGLHLQQNLDSTRAYGKGRNAESTETRKDERNLEA